MEDDLEPLYLSMSSSVPTRRRCPPNTIAFSSNSVAAALQPHEPDTSMARRRVALWWRVCLAGVTLACACACERESKSFHERQVAAARTELPTQGQIVGGGAAPSTGTTSPFQQNAWGISEGKRLFAAYNCTGCHAHGGGGIGPALMDDKWIYGYDARNIFETIVGGRPDGMPSFRNKIPDYQVWQLVAYVQAMSGQVPVDAAPGRDEQMQVRRAEPITAYRGRVRTGHR